MAEYRKQTIIASVIAIVIALSIGLGVYFTQPSTPGAAIPGTAPVLNNHPAILVGMQTTNTTIGLQLSLALNAVTFSPNETVSMNVSEYNTLNTTNYVARGDDWPLVGMALGPCGTLNDPFGISVYPGYYDEGNLSLLANQSSLELYNPGVYACPVMFVVNGYSFRPLSNDATLGINGTMSAPMTAIVNATGSWSSRTVGATFHEFSPDVYTVVAGDEWGDVAIAHFTVTDSTVTG